MSNFAMRTLAMEVAFSNSSCISIYMHNRSKVIVQYHDIPYDFIYPCITQVFHNAMATLLLPLIENVEFSVIINKFLLPITIMYLIGYNLG